ncbi:MAG: DUF1592 domain-containing protein [Acidobacteria bacterium]|nr:DUF1592 domain-containing protein [Acidobacteriota bacterium]
MNRIFITAVVIALGLLATGANPVFSRQSAAGNAGTVGNAAPAAEQALLNRYCITCHNQRSKTAGLALDTMNFEQVGQHADVWERVVRKIRTGMMPPSGASRPERAVLDAFAAELETRLDRAAALSPNPGTAVVSRLNRTEYGNAVRDLLDLDVDVTVLLPGDESSHGFDNIADTLAMSPSLMQGYVSSAAKISRLAVGDRAMTPSRTVLRAQAGLTQDRHIDGLPLGTRGGMLVQHTFPLDAEYEFSTTGSVFTIDGVEVQESNLRNFRLAVKAGPHMLGVAIVDRQRPAGVDDLWSVFSVGGGAPSVTINGPLDADGKGDTPSRRRIFVCYPADTTETAEVACARQIVQTLARRAFRRPVADAEVSRLMDFYRQGRKERDFETGIERALAGVLVSPGFILRTEEEPANLADGAVYRVNDLALASRLSFFLWSSIPDDELLDAATKGRLRDPIVLEQQVRRMLASPKSDALIDNFAAQWLNLRKLATVAPIRPRPLANRVEVEGFTENLRQAFRRETEMLFESIVREDRSIVDLLNADYTFVDERLARHYGMPNVTGSYFRRITLDANSPRRGILGHGSILTLTSAPNRTSPVVRGQWILENILGSPAPDPPPGVETDLDQDPEAAKKKSLRERLEAHRANSVCASCHKIMDPLGLALENFDLIGMWRESDAGSRIDPTGELVDGTRLSGAADLRKALLNRSDAFVTAVVERLMTYALGRAVHHYDMPAARAIVREAAADDYRFSSLILGVVKSMPFQMKKKS